MMRPCALILLLVAIPLSLGCDSKDKGGVQTPASLMDPPKEAPVNPGMPIPK